MATAKYDGVKKPRITSKSLETTAGIKMAIEKLGIRFNYIVGQHRTLGEKFAEETDIVARGQLVEIDEAIIEELAELKARRAEFLQTNRDFFEARATEIRDYVFTEFSWDEEAEEAAPDNSDNEVAA